MGKAAHQISLNADDFATLKSWSSSRSMPYRQVVRARIIILASEGVSSLKIAEMLNLSRPTVQLWRERFLSLGLMGLEKDAARPGRKPKVSSEVANAVVETTLHAKPPSGSHWTTRAMASAHGISEASVRRIWRANNLAPHLVENFHDHLEKSNPDNVNQVKPSAERRQMERSVRRNTQNRVAPAAAEIDPEEAGRLAVARKKTGQLIIALRKEKGLTKPAFAKLCKLSLKALTQVEEGLCQGHVEIGNVADGLGISFVDLLLARVPQKPS